MTEEGAPPLVRRIGLILGPVLAAGMLLVPAPSGLSSEGWSAASIGVLMATWWMTEALPLAATALLPLVLLPPLGVAGFEVAAKSYANPLIFLFLGGFMLAKAMERWRLHVRMALWVTRLSGDHPSSLIAGLMAATAFLSMWVSNTATAMVMLPIGQAVVARWREVEGGAGSGPTGETGAAVMLGIAYAATIGGMATLIGTPPNALFAGFMQSTYGISISFGQWLLIGLPTVLVLLPLTWLVLTRVAFNVAIPRGLTGHAGLPTATGAPSPISQGEVLVGVIMAGAALAWIFNPLLVRLLPSLVLSDAGIAMTAALLLFLTPADWRKGEFLLGWEDVRSIRWDVLILFGGGLALAEAISSSGLAAWIGAAMAGLTGLPLVLLVLIVMFATVLVGELASNTAMAAIFLPVAGAAAVGMGEGPLALALPVAMAASLGFMLPVATPPNAIVYGGGAVTMAQMLRAGAILDVISTLVVAALALTLGRLVFGA